MIYPTLVGRPRRRFASQFDGSPVFVGDDAIAQRYQLTFNYPIDHGHIEDWLDVSTQMIIIRTWFLSHNSKYVGQIEGCRMYHTHVQ